jgi:hypothetical protein
VGQIAEYARLESLQIAGALTRYDTKLWMRDLMEDAAYLPK